MKKLTLNNMGALPYSAEEAMNRLLVNFGLCGKEYKKVIVTSSLPNEGKSFVATHLWRLLAEAGNKVILVDADIRKSVIRSRYQLTTEETNPIGLAHHLAGQAELEDVIYTTNIRGGFIVPTFRTVANPAILLQSGRFGSMLDRLAQVSDYVLVDTPPLTNVSDGGLIASHCDGALLVVRCGSTPKGLVANSIKQLELANCRLLGTVLNRVEQKQNAYYYRYSHYGYGYGYGYGQENSGKKKHHKSGSSRQAPERQAADRQSAEKNRGNNSGDESGN